MSIHAMIGKKVGTTGVFRGDGRADCVTALRVGPCVVTQIKTMETDGYESIQLGFERVNRMDKAKTGHLKEAGGLFRYLREVKADDVSDYEVGQELDASLFQSGDRVDATGFSKGRGFAGGVKRHNFRGGPKTHGQSDRHRAPGSIGAGTSPGRVIKGLKMAGHMGNARVTVRNLEVVQSDAERGLLFVKGGVPGASDALVIVSKSRRRTAK